MKVSIVTPFFNEEGAVEVFFEAVTSVLISEGFDYEIICVNDGSTDQTLRDLIKAQDSYQHVRIVDLSRNFGKEAAISAGLSNAMGDVVIPLDADLQDPPELIPKLVEKWMQGYEVVLAKRVSRQSDSAMKRLTAHWFYRFIDKLADIRIPENVGDFRLMDASVVEALCQLKENRRFMKGLFAWVGFRSTSIEYTRPPRSAGVTKFNGWRLWNFALEGITSFSTALLRVWTYFGGLIALCAFGYAGFIAIRTLLRGVDVPGYASLLTIMLFLGGLQLVGLGIIGEYLGRIYLEAKRRPPFLIRRIYTSKADDSGLLGPAPASRLIRPWPAIHVR